MNRHKCYKCGRVRNSDQLVKIAIPIYIQRLFDGRRSIYLCKNFTKGWYNNFKMAQTSITCLERYERDIISLDKNVTSGLTILARNLNEFSLKYKPFRYKNNEK